MKQLFWSLFLILGFSLQARAACGSMTGGWACKNAVFGNSGGSSATSQAATTFSAALTNGSIILVEVDQLAASPTFSVTDTAGNTYVDCGKGRVSWHGAAASNQVFYALNTHTTASNVVTAHSTTNATFLQVLASEFTGNASSSPVDKFAGQGTTSGSGSNNETSTSATTAANGDLIWGEQNNISGTISVGTGFTDLGISGYIEANVQTTASSVAATWNNTSSGDDYVAIMVAIKPPSASHPNMVPMIL